MDLSEISSLERYSPVIVAMGAILATVVITGVSSKLNSRRKASEPEPWVAYHDNISPKDIREFKGIERIVTLGTIIELEESKEFSTLYRGSRFYGTATDIMNKEENPTKSYLVNLSFPKNISAQVSYSGENMVKLKDLLGDPKEPDKKVLVHQWGSAIMGISRHHLD